MVEAHPQDLAGQGELSAALRDPFTDLVSHKRELVIAELMPFLDLPDLVRFSSLNKSCRAILDPHSPKCLRYDVLLATRTHD